MLNDLRGNPAWTLDGKSLRAICEHANLKLSELISGYRMFFAVSSRRLLDFITSPKKAAWKRSKIISLMESAEINENSFGWNFFLFAFSTRTLERSGKSTPSRSFGKLKLDIFDFYLRGKQFPFFHHDGQTFCSSEAKRVNANIFASLDSSCGSIFSSCRQSPNHTL